MYCPEDLKDHLNLFLATRTSCLSLDTSINHTTFEFLLCAALGACSWDIQKLGGITPALKWKLYNDTVVCWNHLLKLQECCKPLAAYHIYTTETSKSYKLGLVF